MDGTSVKVTDPNALPASGPEDCADDKIVKMGSGLSGVTATQINCNCHTSPELNLVFIISINEPPNDSGK